jgi:hypothetical protein
MKQAASALLAALIICTTFSLFLVYYLSLIEQQNSLSARSQTWNMAIAVTEAGIEDGLQHLNVNYQHLATDGWQYIGGNTYYRSNALANGNSYTAFITNGITPIITARAYVELNSIINLAQRIVPGFFADVTAQRSPTIVTRAVKVTCAKSGLLLAAMVAKHQINLKGNNVRADSFDSSDPNKSTGGQYDPNKAGDRGDISTNDGLQDSLSAGNANIFGHTHTGVGTNALTLGSQGAVGDHPWQANNKGVQAGWYAQDANFTFPENSFPDTSGYFTPTSGVYVATTYATNTVSTTTTTYPPSGTYLGSVSTNTSNGGRIITGYTYFLISSTTPIYSTNSYDHILWGTTDGSTNYYVATDLGGSTVVTGPNVVVALPNGLQMASSDTITILPTANLAAYSGSASSKITGNGVINQTGLAYSFIVYCANTLTDLDFSFSGNGAFKGVLIAPTADVKLSGSGNSQAIDFTGALMANSITLNGKFNFHYDEALGTLNKNGRYLITAWNEIP